VLAVMVDAEGSSYMELWIRQTV